MNGTVLIVGAGGARGRAVVEALRAGGVDALALRRDPKEAGDVAGDLGDPASLRSAFARADLVVHIAPLSGVDPRVAVGNARAAATERGVPVIHHAGSAFGEGDDLPPLQAMERAQEAAWRATGLPLTALRPTLYLENLLQPWCSGRIRGEGVLAYPLRPETRIAWTSAADLGAATLVAVRGEIPTGAGVTIAGARNLDGPELATLVGAAVGRDVRYEYLPEDAFEAGLAAHFGPEAASAVAAQYRAANVRPTDNEMTTARADRLGGDPAEALARLFA